MPESQIKQLILLSQNLLKEINESLEHFLNFHAVNNLVYNEGQIVKTCELLSDLRHLLVNCENTYQKLGVVARSHHFNKDFAEQILYETVYLCVHKFYYPAHEVYEEDGRHSYTGKDAIKFSYTPHPDIKKIILALSKTFEVLREELSYYETDYVTKKRLQQGEQFD
ncbi:MAG: DUF3907 family protein [Tepidibacillus sp.]|uniref:DUF3907 family protein n=1 Tax=Tepidibacillus sp. HK-1 TaxID=1883407 RepID=UPI0008534111|nr:DUF3907 family protein [Tepidibacillus sp. HK-1]GBF12408.1 hypothetical protein HK1_02469 [Tepidibacillus sp. HK-1]